MALVNFLNTTTDNYRALPEAEDLVFHKNGFLDLIRSKGTIKYNVGGIESRVPWETGFIGDAAATSIFTWDGGDTALPVYAQDNILESGAFDWKFFGGITFQTELEKLQNRGKAQWINIAVVRYQALVKRLSRYLEEGLLTLSGATVDVAGLPSFMNNTDASYGGGLDLTDADFGPHIVSVGATLSSLTLDHLNEAFSLTQDGDDHVDAIIGAPEFLQQMRTLVMPDQVYNQGGGTWNVGPLGINWFGVIPIKTSRYLTSYVDGSDSTYGKIYGLRMKNIVLEFGYGGNGFNVEGWDKLQSKLGTYFNVITCAIRSYCINPNDNFLVRYTA
jgi:hypothetical protein